MLNFVNRYIIGASVPIVLILGGLFYLIFLRFRPLRAPREMLRQMLWPTEKQGISPFRSVTMALAGTLGVGNIVGVATAIALGGFGAVFWMWISALAAMILKYAEITLAMAHRREETGTDGRKEYHGGAVYYIRDFFLARGQGTLGVVFSVLFALLCLLDSLSMGCIVQVNAVSGAFAGVFGIPSWACGLTLALLTAAVIVTGARGISRLTELLVPFMSLGYVILSLIVIFRCRERLPWAFARIFSDAFTVTSPLGGVAGFLLSDALRYGTMRGLLSNEAGCGTAPFAHAASGNNEPARQGVWGIFEVFVDTILLCTMTALVILLNYDAVCRYADNGIMMTIRAYAAVLGPSAGYFLAIAVFLFAYATVICWAHYGLECIEYLRPGKRLVHVGYILLFCGCTFAGTMIAPQAVWGSADFAIGSMTLMNLFVVCLMAGEVRQYTDRIFPMKRPGNEKRCRAFCRGCVADACAARRTEKREEQ